MAIIYTITVFEKIEEQIYPSGKYSGFPDFGDSRVWGYYMDRNDALRALHENVTDMHETCYNYAVLEAVKEGVANPSTDKTWFAYDKEKDGYFEINEPKIVEHTCGFSMG